MGRVVAIAGSMRDKGDPGIAEAVEVVGEFAEIKRTWLIDVEGN